MDTTISALSWGQIRQVVTESATLKFLSYSIDEEDEQALIIPVSQYTHPQTDHEMVVTTKDGERIVLQVWNARHSALYRVKESEVIGNITKKEQAKVQEVLLYCLLGEDVSEQALANMGPSSLTEDQCASYMLYAADSIKIFDRAGL